MVFEQSEIICVDLRAQGKIPQACVVQHVKAEQSERFIQSKLLEIVMQGGIGIQSLRAIQNVRRGNGGRHQEQVRPVAVPKRGAMKFREEGGQDHPQVIGV